MEKKIINFKVIIIVLIITLIIAIPLQNHVIDTYQEQQRIVGFCESQTTDKLFSYDAELGPWDKFDFKCCYDTNQSNDFATEDEVYCKKYTKPEAIKRGYWNE